jgi:hypothetical protein
MFVVTGKLSNKSLVKSGVSEHGAWKIVVFIIEKTRNKKPIKIPLTAKGKLAIKVDDIPIGEKITVEFFIEGKKYNDKYFTDCIATNVDKYVPKKKYIHGQVSMGNEVFSDDSELLDTDIHLFREEKDGQQ